MENFIYFWHMLGQVAKNAFTSPLFLVIYILLFILITWQYARLAKNAGLSLNNSALAASLTSAFYGILGGVIGSFLLIITGIDLALIGMGYLWVAAVVLMLINPRYLCFAYAGGAVGLISFIFGYPDINIPHLMGLVAVLHLVESILIYLNGHFNPVPIKIKKGNLAVEGFNLQKFWPLPLLVLISTGYNYFSWTAFMPEWWPLLPAHEYLSCHLEYKILPVLAVLGYGEITTTGSPRERCRKSSRNLLVFSLVLLVLCFLACRFEAFMPVLVLASPLGHEFVIWLGMREEGDEKSIFNYRECSLFIYLMNRLRTKKF